MTDVKALLPSSSGPFERALAAGMSDALPVPYAELMDPYLTRADLLPWLAAHYSLDLWFDDWPEARKREAIAQAAGRSTIHPAVEIASLKSTRTGTHRYLALVDGTVIDIVSHPQRVVLGRTAWRRAPVGHPAFKARHLVKVETFKQPRAWVLGRTPLGKTIAKASNREPLERAMKAMRAAKGADTEYRVDFGHRRMITIDDNIDIDAGFQLAAYVDRTRL